MQPLNFPQYSFRIKSSENKTWVFDRVRRKHVLLQPEEWVRQHVLHFLIETKKYPESLINVEKQLSIKNLKKRYDIVVYQRDGNINILVECKAPSVKLTQEAFDQIARYNMQLRANYLMLSNGLNHYYCKMDYDKEKYIFLKEIPDFRR